MSKQPYAMKGLDHVVIRCIDLTSMLHFYCDVLGCTLEDEDKELGLYQVRAGDHLIDLAPVEEPMGAHGGPAPGRDGHNMHHFAIQVEPFDDDAIRIASSSKGSTWIAK